jgi:hypothetical protein
MPRSSRRSRELKGLLRPATPRILWHISRIVLSPTPGIASLRFPMWSLIRLIMSSG